MWIWFSAAKAGEVGVVVEGAEEDGEKREESTKRRFEERWEGQLMAAAASEESTDRDSGGAFEEDSDEGDSVGELGKEFVSGVGLADLDSNSFQG
mmetsp:Transcript_23276/g.41303  ORF Transcript_23276/g.41303 Transcript_23276/m.41303 type:complete len:95 (-) Transcript_23276:625-909(-)